MNEIENLLLISKYLGYMKILFFPLVIISFLFFYIFRKTENRNTKYITGIMGMLLCLPIILSLSVSGFLRKKVISVNRLTLEEYVKQENLTMYQNGIMIKNYRKQVISNYLSNIKPNEYHHSSREDLIIICMKKDNDSTNISLYQDSNRKYEFWVYWDKYELTESTLLGRIQVEDNDIGTILGQDRK